MKVLEKHTATGRKLLKQGASDSKSLPNNMNISVHVTTGKKICGEVDETKPTKRPSRHTGGREAAAGETGLHPPPQPTTHPPIIAS